MLSRGRGLWGRLLVVALGAALMPVLSASPAHADVPSVPLNPVVEQTSLDELTFTFDPPADAGGSPVVGYTVSCRWNLSSGPVGYREDVSTSPVVISLSEFDGGFSGHCAIWARNDDEDGEPALTGTFYVTRSTAGTPADPKVWSYADDSVGVGFDMPAGAGGVAETECISATGAVIEAERGATDPDGTGIREAVYVSGVVPGDRYRCRVRLVHDLGSTEWSTWSNEHLHVWRPLPPKIQSVEAVSPRAVAVDATAVTDEKRPITAYEASCDLGDGSGAVSATTSASPVTVHGLRPARTYHCRVRAENDAGWSNDTEATVTTPPAVPGLPHLASVRYAKKGDWWVRARAVRVKLRTGETNGRRVWRTRTRCVSLDGRVTRQNVTFHRGGLVRGERTAMKVGNLVAGKKYRCKARHKNSVGWGDWSGWQRARVWAREPGRPRWVKARRVWRAGVKARLEVRRHHRSVVVWARIKCVSPNGGKIAKQTKTHAPALRRKDRTAMIVYGLSPRKRYRCKAKLRNYVGWGTWSSWVRLP